MVKKYLSGFSSRRKPVLGSGEHPRDRAFLAIDVSVVLSWNLHGPVFLNFVIFAPFGRDDGGSEREAIPDFGPVQVENCVFCPFFGVGADICTDKTPINCLL